MLKLVLIGVAVLAAIVYAGIWARGKKIYW
jgi:hypothetical protein